MGLKVLVTGRGSGSWEIRGNQLGAKIGAHVDPLVNSVKGFDLAIVVKRPRADVITRLQHRGVPIVWDIVDAWPQPEGNLWDHSQCMHWMRGKVSEIQPAAIVATTQAMANDCAEFKLPVLVLPHHVYPKIGLNPVRPMVKTVGYEGGEQYLGRWRTHLEAACSARGWAFVVNPASYCSMDIVVAMREQQGYAPRKWKSNVKLANAQGSGTPCILNREAGYTELASGAERWADTEEELDLALDELANHQTRLSASTCLLRAAPRIESVAEHYKQWLRHLVS